MEKKARTRDENPNRCGTCNNTECKYFGFKEVRYGKYDDGFGLTLALTPSAFTSEMGCMSWIG